MQILIVFYLNMENYEKYQKNRKKLRFFIIFY